MKRLVLLAVLLSAALARGGPADPDSLIWASEEAAVDSLNAYWRGLESDWYEPLTLDELDLGLSAVQLDSLVIEGDTVIARMIAGRPWLTRVRPLRHARFNRVTGLDVGGEVVLYRPGVRQPRLSSRASYGLSWKKLSHAHSLSLPVATARLYDDEGYRSRAPWTWLPLEAEGGHGAEWFAGDRREERNLAAFFSGEDPNHYYARTHWRASLRLRPRPFLTLWLGGGGGRHRPLGVRTDWSLFGDREAVGGNLQVAGLSRRTLHAGLQVSRGGLWMRGRQEWHRVSDSPLPDVADAAGGKAWYRRLAMKAGWHGHDPWGDEWVLSANWQSLDRQAPLEWMTYLGDHGTLRGFAARELAGDRGAWASLDVRWDLDPFRTLRIPLLKGLGLQPITFADWGRVERIDGALDDYPGADGWRADVGVGLGKRLGLGGMLNHVRAYAARPVGAGSEGRPWVFVVALEGR
ncbi:hypothetical protein H8E07_02690 [bacterium]|nr:hypothetical protein [bacterium]